MMTGSDIADIVWLSLRVSVVAAFLGLAIGAPLGAWICTLGSVGRRIWLTVFATLLAVPTVVIGLIVYLALSRSGPLGWLDLLFTPTAIMIAQTLITLPVVTMFSHRACAELWRTHGDAIRLDVPDVTRQVLHLMQMAKAGIAMAFLVAFGRAISEVGAVMIVGGNIRDATRVMTTAITLETRQGNFSVAITLGVILLAVSLSVTLATWLLTQERPA